MECPHYQICLNRDKCYRCNNGNLLRVKTAKARLARFGRSVAWRRLEGDVARRLAGSGGATRRQPASGAKWYAPGDVLSPECLVECKTHVTSSKGEKQHTVYRAELEKITAEAAMLGRLPVYAFRFKGDDKIYAVLEFDLLEELIAAVRGKG